MNIIITESQYKRIVEQPNERVNANYDVLNWKYGYEDEYEDENWALIIQFSLKISIGNKSYEYVFTAGGNVTEDDEWEIEDERVDWDIVNDNNNYLKSVNGREVNLPLDKQKIEEVIFATDYSQVENKISEIYQEAYD